MRYLTTIVYMIAAVLFLAALAGAQGTITVLPDTQYSQRDTFVTVNILADADFANIKALQLDIDVDPAVIQADQAHVSLGSLWVNDPDSTFLYHVASPDKSRLTIDIAVLGDGRTKSGPGSLVSIRYNTVGFGISNINITTYKARDTLNQPVTVNIENAWVQVCRFVGDINGDNRIDLIDLSMLVAYLVQAPGAAVPSPMASANTNCAGIVDLGDLSTLIGYLVANGHICKYCL